MATTEYGIRYFKAQLDKTTYILIPINLVQGYSVSNSFFSDKVYICPQTDVDYKDNRTVVDSIVSEDQLKLMYDMDDIEFLKDYYLSEEKDQVIIVELKEGKIRKRKFILNLIKNSRLVAPSLRRVPQLYSPKASYIASQLYSAYAE